VVFEIQRLGVVEPCWPCEGHYGPDEKLWKRPTVWFYCDDVIHLRLLTDAIEGLYVAWKLNFQWFIRITYSGTDCRDMVFALELERRRLGNAKLGDMFDDISIMAENPHDLP
jgi:hypothetical protein